MMSEGIRSGVNWILRKSQSRRGRQGANDGGLPKSGRALKQRMAFGKKRRQHAANDVFLTDEDLAHLCAQALESFAELCGALFIVLAHRILKSDCWMAQRHALFLWANGFEIASHKQAGSGWDVLLVYSVKCRRSGDLISGAVGASWLLDHRRRPRGRAGPAKRLRRFRLARKSSLPSCATTARLPPLDRATAEIHSPIRALRPAAHCRRRMAVDFSPPGAGSKPAPFWPSRSSARQPCFSFRATAATNGGDHPACRVPARGAKHDPSCSLRQSAFLAASSRRRLTLNDVRLVPEPSRVQPDPIGRSFGRLGVLASSEDRRPVLRDPERGRPQERFSLRRSIRMATKVFLQARRGSGELLGAVRANRASSCSASFSFSAICLKLLVYFRLDGPRRAGLAPAIAGRSQALEQVR